MTDFDDLKKELEQRRNRTDVVGRVPSGLKQATLGQVRQRPPPLPVHATRPQQGTQVGIAPPGPGNKLPPPPVPLAAPELDSTLESPKPEPRTVSPAFGTPAARLPALEEAVRRRGDRLVIPPESVAAPSATPSSAPGGGKALMAKLAIIGGVFTGASGLVATFTKGIVEIMDASRGPTVKAALERIEALEKAREQDDGVKLEAKARRAKDEEHERENRKQDARLDKLEAEPRAQTIQGLPTK